MTACTQCGERVEPRAEYGPHGNVSLVARVDERGWCSDCLWMEGPAGPTEITDEWIRGLCGCSRCGGSIGDSRRGLCDAHEEQALNIADEARETLPCG